MKRMDRAVGILLITVGTVFMTYYTCWVILLPFVSSENKLDELFLPRVYAVAAPLVLGILGLLVVGIFTVLKLTRKAPAANE